MRPATAGGAVRQEGDLTRNPSTNPRGAPPLLASMGQNQSGASPGLSEVHAEGLSRRGMRLGDREGQGLRRQGGPCGQGMSPLSKPVLASTGRPLHPGSSWLRGADRRPASERAPPVFGGAGAPGAQPGDVLRAATRWRALPSPLGSARACAGEGAGDPGLVLALG